MSWQIEDLNRRLLRARDAMDRAYAEPLEVRAVAAVAHLSEATFSRTFREIIGETPSAYRGGHGPMVAPNCVQMWAMRPRVAARNPNPVNNAAQSSRIGEAAMAAVP